MTSMTGGGLSTIVGATGRRLLLVVLAVAQIVAPILSERYGGTFTTEDRPGEPPIVPASYAFTIWGLVELLALGYAAWALPLRRPALALRDRLATPLVVVYAGFSLWLLAAELEPLWTTVVVFLVMVAGLLRAMQIALAARAEIARWPTLGRALLWGMLGIYLGWSSVAIWINLTTGLVGSGVPITGVAGILGQLAVLAGATATAVVILHWTDGLLPYAAAVAWAFVGVGVGAARAGAPVLAGAAAVGLAAVLAALATLRRSGSSGPDRR